MAKGIPFSDNKKHIKGDPRNIYREKQDFSWVEVEAPSAIEGEDGTPMDAIVVVPDTKYAYGDNESVALMAGDVVTRRSPDPDAGVKAYEASRKQLDQNQDVRRRKAHYTKMRSRVPVADVRFLRPGRWELTYMFIDPKTGLYAMKRKELTDEEMGGLYEKVVQTMPATRDEDGTGWYVPDKAR